MSTRGRLAAGFALAFVAGCSRDVAPQVPTGPPRPRWVIPAEALAGNVRLPFDPSLRELAVLDLPQAGFPGPDVLAPGSCAFLLNLQMDGTLYFKGNTWKSDAQGFEKLRRELELFVRRRGGGGSCVRLVRADRTAPWSTVRELIDVATRGDHGLRQVRFSLQGRDLRASGGDAALDADVEPAPVAAATPLPIRITRSTAAGVEVAVADLVAAFGPVDALTDDPAALQAANRAWDDVEARIAAGVKAGSRAARVEPADAVPWAYVAQTLSMLHEKGIVDVDVPQVDGRLHLHAPPARPVLDHRRLFDDDWPAGLAIGLGAALGVLALGLPALRRGRRRFTSARPPMGA